MITLTLTKERVSMPNLSEGAKKQRAKYMREWRKRNPDKVRQYDSAKWERKAKYDKEKSQSDISQTTDYIK